MEWRSLSLATRQLASSRCSALGRPSSPGSVPPQPDEAEPGEWAHGWQYYESSARETYFKEHQVLPFRRPNEKALLRSQAGPKAGRTLTALPACRPCVISYEGAAGCRVGPWRVWVCPVKNERTNVHSHEDQRSAAS